MIWALNLERETEGVSHIPVSHFTHRIGDRKVLSHSLRSGAQLAFGAA